MRVFLDTNVLFSGLHSSHGPPARILEAVARGEIEAVMSVDVLVDSFCTGDRRLRDRLAAARGRCSFIVLTPAELARQLTSRPNDA